MVKRSLIMFNERWQFNTYSLVQDVHVRQTDKLQFTDKYTLKWISNRPPSFCYILGKEFAEKYKKTKTSLKQFIPNIENKTTLKCDYGNKLKV